MSTLTKKHYEAIALMLQNAHDTIAESAHAKTVVRLHAYNLADYFAQNNPRFDRTRFLQACGIKEKVCQHNKPRGWCCDF